MGVAYTEVIPIVAPVMGSNGGGSRPIGRTLSALVVVPPWATAICTEIPHRLVARDDPLMSIRKEEEEVYV